MGTKSNPSSFDCYAAAEPDEPIFVLLARDRHAADLVAHWAQKRQLEGTTDRAKIAEAIECSEAMREWREQYEARQARAAKVAELQQAVRTHRVADAFDRLRQHLRRTA